MVLCKKCGQGAEEVQTTVAELEKEYEGVKYQQHVIIKRTFVHYNAKYRGTPGFRLTCEEVPATPMVLQSIPKHEARPLALIGA